jgi:hypothetical protein
MSVIVNRQPGIIPSHTPTHLDHRDPLLCLVLVAHPALRAALVPLGVAHHVARRGGADRGGGGGGGGGGRELAAAEADQRLEVHGHVGASRGRRLEQKVAGALALLVHARAGGGGRGRGRVDHGRRRLLLLLLAHGLGGGGGGCGRCCCFVRALQLLGALAALGARQLLVGHGSIDLDRRRRRRRPYDEAGALRARVATIEGLCLPGLGLGWGMGVWVELERHRPGLREVFDSKPPSVSLGVDAIQALALEIVGRVCGRWANNRACDRVDSIESIGRLRGQMLGGGHTIA